jgi:AcrR family transcriptional regulator
MAPTRDNRTHRRPKEERYEEVLAAAAKTIAERGYRGATIHDIARELRVTPAALYHYVDSKEDLLWDICSRAANRLLTGAQEILASDLSAEEKLRRLFHRHLELITSDRAIFTILIHERWELPDERRAELRQGDRLYFDTVRQVFDLFEREALRVQDSRLAALAMFGMLNWVLRWYREDGRYDVGVIAEAFYRTFTHGILE